MGLLALSSHRDGSSPRSGMRLTVIGRRDRLPDGLAAEIGAAEAATAGGTRSICGSPSTTPPATRFCGRASVRGPGPDARGLLAARHRREAALRDVDLVIRTSGEKRLSDFLLWESAYAELHFTQTMWPDFGSEDLVEALAVFRRRERRFGGLRWSLPVPPPRASPSPLWGGVGEGVSPPHSTFDAPHPDPLPTRGRGA